ncbi:hypothetical protein Dimus_037494, partial [Dionaea muscipula]
RISSEFLSSILLWFVLVPPSLSRSSKSSPSCAPPNRLRREGPDIRIGVPPERCAHKRKSERLLPRSLSEKTKRATAEDGEFHVSAGVPSI